MSSLVSSIVAYLGADPHLVRWSCGLFILSSNAKAKCPSSHFRALTDTANSQVLPFLISKYTMNREVSKQRALNGLTKQGTKQLARIRNAPRLSIRAPVPSSDLYMKERRKEQTSKRFRAAYYGYVLSCWTPSE